MPGFREYNYRADQLSPSNINFLVRCADDTSTFRITGFNPGNSQVTSGNFTGLRAYGVRDRSEAGLHCRALWVRWTSRSSRGNEAGSFSYVVIFRTQLFLQAKPGRFFSWRNAGGVVVSKYPEITRG